MNERRKGKVVRDFYASSVGANEIYLIVYLFSMSFCFFMQSFDFFFVNEICFFFCQEPEKAGNEIMEEEGSLSVC